MKPSSVDGGRLEYKRITQAGSELPRHVTNCRGSFVFQARAKQVLKYKDGNTVSPKDNTKRNAFRAFYQSSPCTAGLADSHDSAVRTNISISTTFGGRSGLHYGSVDRTILGET